MPIRINEVEYYTTVEACRRVGISKSTLLRWIRTGIFPEVKLKDRRGWRLFTEDDLDRLKVEVNRINER